MVNHALFVATANPLEHRLLFEHLLSERRTPLPDIDIDVESERLLEVYDTIIKRFGRERTAVTGMPETYRARHARHFPVRFSVLKSERVSPRAVDCSGQVAGCPQRRPPTSSLPPSGSRQRSRLQPDVSQPLARGPRGDA
ncbi:putative Error-prone DNA polymerase [Streptomyces afghaniensis 772]|uniref:Putative Error-prone DNA polymerase n=1 Tax=Streptomyces afghaniensis 772 TaxID=1283301 RepID=S4N003_9ACTN|nr:putative Error-prone DNA polymerase [Streptomyces afghaniensis 772]